MTLDTEALRDAGFVQIGEFSYHFVLRIWWNKVDGSVKEHRKLLPARVISFLDRQALQTTAFQRRLYAQREWPKYQALRLRARQQQAQQQLSFFRQMQQLSMTLGQAGARARWFSR